MAGASPTYTALGPPEAAALREGGPQAARAALVEARARTLALAEDYAQALASASLQVPYDPGLNPPIWEWGHVAWFQEWWIARNSQRHLGVRADPEAARTAPSLAGADALYDSGRVRHTTRWHLPLPDAAGTHRYLAHTLAATLEALDALPADATHDALYFFRLAALHEMMHAEAAAYMARTLGLALPEPEPPRLPGEAEDLIVPAQRITLGASSTGFAFDNELQAETLDLPAFRIDAHAVSWARFLPFLEAGGYEQTQWWSEAGKDWLHTQPAPWRRDADGRWLQRRGPQWCTVNLQHAAVHLSAHEAEAWCRWAGRRLPTEAEWECAARSAPGFAWGAAWEWTASAFAPRAGFEPHPYRDYSAPWFHTRRTLKGACPATSPWLAHGSYRNFFEPHRRDVFAGFRSAA